MTDQISVSCDEWISEARRIGKLLGWSHESMSSIDEEAWKEYFHMKYTPAEAWLVELESY